MNIDFTNILIWIVAIIVIFIVMKYAKRWYKEGVGGTCWWCSKNWWMTRYEYKRLTGRWTKDVHEKMYCSGKCIRADEASRGVKENRKRVIKDWEY